jgi:hypothetical protein
MTPTVRPPSVSILEIAPDPDPAASFTTCDPAIARMSVCRSRVDLVRMAPDPVSTAR